MKAVVEQRLQHAAKLVERAGLIAFGFGDDVEAGGVAEHGAVLLDAGPGGSADDLPWLDVVRPGDEVDQGHGVQRERGAGGLASDHGDEGIARTWFDGGDFEGEAVLSEEAE